LKFAAGVALDALVDHIAFEGSSAAGDSVMADISTCKARACRAVTPGLVEACPRCGGRVQTSRHVRILGWVLLALGLFLIAFMGYITLQTYDSFARPGMSSADGSRFTGDAEQGRMILNVFWLVIGFGALSAVNGVWQIVTGRRNMIFVAISLLVAAVLVFTTWETTDALKNAEDEPRRIVQPPPMPSSPSPATAPDKPQ
jgi:hypothetical protein